MSLLGISKYDYTAKDRQSHPGCYQSAMTTADTGGGRETLSSGVVPSMTPGRGTHDQSRAMVNTAPSFGDQGVKCASFVTVDEVQDSSSHFPGTEGNEQSESESESCSLDWNSEEC